MRRKSGLAAALVTAALVALIGLAALGARGTPGAGNRSLSAPGSLDPTVVIRLVLVILLAGAILLGIAGWAARRPRSAKRSRSKRGSVIGPAILLTALLVAFLNLGRSIDITPAEQVATSTTAAPINPGTAEATGSRWGLVFLAGAVLLAAGAVAAVRRRTAEPEPDDAPDGAVAGVIESVIAEMEESDDPRAVIIRSYARIERAFADNGLPRRPSEAPNEYLTRVLTRLDVRPTAVTRLVRLFEEARFSDHAVDTAMSGAAVAAMRAVHDELSGATS